MVAAAGLVYRPSTKPLQQLASYREHKPLESRLTIHSPVKETPGPVEGAATELTHHQPNAFNDS